VGGLLTGGVLLGASGTAGAVESPLVAQQENGDGNGEPSPFAAVQFGNQASDGTEVVVDSTVLSDGGFVTFHDLSLFEARPLESVVGISAYLDPGIHTGVSAQLFDVPGREFEEGQLTEQTPLVAMPHADSNDNQTYEFVTSEGEEDVQYVQAELPVVDLGFVTPGEAPADEEGRFAQLAFENQAVADGTVTVQEAVLSDGGFVVLHDARLFQGDAFESVVGVSAYLEPGIHQAVEVQVEDPGAITQVEFPPVPPLVPMAHRDTNDNQSYDFTDSEGQEDGPYVSGGQAVVDLGFVATDGGQEN
jgi:hypothetical protein